MCKQLQGSKRSLRKLRCLQCSSSWVVILCVSGLVFVCWTTTGKRKQWEAKQAWMWVVQTVSIERFAKTKISQLSKELPQIKGLFCIWYCLINYDTYQFSWTFPPNEVIFYTWPTTSLLTINVNIFFNSTICGNAQIFHSWQSSQWICCLKICCTWEFYQSTHFFCSLVDKTTTTIDRSRVWSQLKYQQLNVEWTGYLQYSPYLIQTMCTLFEQFPR